MPHMLSQTFALVCHSAKPQFIGSSMTDDAFMSSMNPFKSSTVYEARVSRNPSIFSRKRKPCASEGEDRRMSEFESESTVGEFDDLGFDFEIVDTDEFDPFAPDPDDPEAVAADEIEELPVIKEMPESQKKPSVYDQSRFACPEDAIRELFARNFARKPVLLKIIELCCQERTSGEVTEMVDEFQKDCFSVYSALSLCTMLEKSGALVAKLPENADEAVDEDGVEYLEIREPQQATWLATDAGLTVLAECREGSELDELISVRDARYADIYRDLLNFLHEQGRTMGAINDRYAGDERLENPHKAPSHFIDCLQEVGAVEWKNRGWCLTDLGENYLKKNATAQA